MRTIYQKYKVMIHNFSYLTILKALTLILPLITFPYLIRTLGAEKYGLVMWAWAISEMFIVFTKFGFDTLGVKLISENRHDRKKLSDIFSQIMFVKVFLFLLSLIILLFLTNYVDKISQNHQLFFYYSFFIFFESMLPIWYFQGIENMKIMAVLVSSIKLIFALLVFVLIKDSSQYLYVPILYAAGSFLANTVAFYIILFKHSLSWFFTKIDMRNTFLITKESCFIFFATIGTVIRDRGTIILIEKYLGLESVAYFDLSMRIVNILLTPFHIVSQVIYPHIAKTRDMVLLKKVLLITVLLSGIVVVIFLFGVDKIALLLNGSVNSELKNTMSMLIFIVPIGIVSLLIGDNVLIVSNNSVWILYSMIIPIVCYGCLFFIFPEKNLRVFSILFLSYFFVEMLTRLIGTKLIVKDMNA